MVRKSSSNQATPSKQRRGHLLFPISSDRARGQLMPLNPISRDLAIRTILAEAEGEGPEGQAAVANVMKNRTLSGAWGDPYSGHGLRDVISAQKQFAAPKAVNPNDPMYKRVGAIVDAIFENQTGDNTSGATHFYSPANMPGGATPSWAVGQQGRRLGGHVFYRLPLNASSTAGTVDVHAPPPGAAASGGDDGSKAFLASISSHNADRAGDTANLNPQFATRLAAAIKQARDSGLNVSVFSAFRQPGTLVARGDASQAAQYDAGGNSSHSYGLAVDIAGLDGANGPKTQRWAQIAQANGLNNPYGVGNAKEYNHWQLPSAPLERTPQLLASLKAAAATGDFTKVWAAYSGASPESQVATRQSYPPVASAGPAPAAPPAADVPAAQAQPVAALAPKGQPAALPGASDANSRYQVLQGMTAGGGGQGGRNPFLYTAMNLAPGAGPPPATPSPGVQTARPDLAQRVALDQTPQPPPRPADLGVQAVVRAPAVPPPRPPDLTLNNADGSSPVAQNQPPGYGAPPDVLASMQRLLQGLFPT
jgi:hypothetical protein